MTTEAVKNPSTSRSAPTFRLADDDSTLEWTHHCGARAARAVDVVVLDNPQWQLVELQPLSLRQPLFCIRCGLHGWIRQGEWVEIRPAGASPSPLS